MAGPELAAQGNYARESSDSPILNAFCRVAPSDRFSFLAIFAAGAFLRAIDFNFILDSKLLDEVLPGPSFTPASARDRARMRMAMGIVDSYGYGALIAVAGYHLFPDFIGGADEEARKHGIADSRRVLQELMKLRGRSAFIAGERPSLGDFYVAPICFLVSLTPDADEVFAVDGFAKWWEQTARNLARVDAMRSCS